MKQKQEMNYQILTQVIYWEEAGWGGVGWRETERESIGIKQPL